LIFNDLLKVKNAVPQLRENIQEVKNTLRTIDGKREVFEEIIEKELDSQYLPVPELPKVESLNSKVYELESKIREAKKLEEEKRQLEQVEKPEEVENKEEEYNEVIRRVQKADGIIELEIEKLKKMLRIKDYSVCPTCGAKIEYDEKLEEEQRQYIKKLQKAREELQEKQRELKLHQDKYTKYLKASTLYTESQKKLAYILIPDVTEIEKEIIQLRELDKKQNEEYEKVKQEREKAISHNAHLDAEKKNKENAKVELAQLEEKEKASKALLQDLELLLEICDKVIIEKQIPKRLELLEKLINIELSNFTSQYKIKLDMNEKIKPKIVKNGKEYPYENCSQGERGRINLALLFAIRCILEKIDKPVPNFLFIDELLNIIDTGGKELIVTTLQTLDITSMIVCHDYEFDIPQLVLIKKENKTNVQR
jgi:DNA repair exonuclease SbcCD ATPase subunit